MRKLIKDADPDVVEEWKWMGTPIWSHDGIICTGESYKNVVKLTFFRGASLKDPAKPQLGLAMVRRAIDDGLSRGVVLADSAYGFRQGLRDLALDYAVGVDPKTVVWVLDAQSRCRGDPVSVRDLALRIDERRGFRRCTWRKATKHDLSARFALRRVTRLPESTRSAMPSGSSSSGATARRSLPTTSSRPCPRTSPGDNSSGSSCNDGAPSVSTRT